MVQSMDAALPHRRKQKPGTVAHTLIPALGRLRQEDHEFEASLGHTPWHTHTHYQQSK